MPEFRRCRIRSEYCETRDITSTSLRRAARTSRSELKRLVDDIHRLARSIGRALATSAAGAMRPFWNDFAGRFNLGRPGHVVQLDAAPQAPLAYLYQLGLRYFALEPTAPDPQRALSDLLALLASATAMLDLVPGCFGLMFARAVDIVPILRQSTAYDSVFLVTQAKVSHVKTFLDWMMRHPSFASLKSKSGVSAAQVHSLASMLLHACATAKVVDEFKLISPVAAAVAADADVGPAVALLRDIFCHKNGANQSLTFRQRTKTSIRLSGRFSLSGCPRDAAAVDWRAGDIERDDGLVSSRMAQRRQLRWRCARTDVRAVRSRQAGSEGGNRSPR